MATRFRTYSWPLSLALLLLVILMAGLVALRHARITTPGAGDMPPAQQAYWEWVRSINRDGEEAALASGLDLLAAYPDLPTLYLRLAEVCLEAEASAACRAAMQQAQPKEARAGLYRDAALIQLWEYEEALPQPFREVPVSVEDTQNPWQTLARFPDLDPTLARLIVDQVSAKGKPAPWLDDVEAAWRDQLAADSAAVGAAFGLGYAAVLRRDWETGEPYLLQAMRLAPGDPQVYRELGRIYFEKSDPDQLENVLQAGIEAARNRHDQEQALILSGNLGWSIVRRSGDLAEAESLLTDALERSRALSDEESKGFNFYRLASIYLKQYRYDEALAYLDSAAGRYAQYRPFQHPEVVALRGTAYRMMLRYSDAEAELERSIDEAEERGNVLVKIQALNALAFLRYQMGRFEAAREAGLEALDLASRYRLPESEIAARQSLADIERHLGNFDQATTHLEPALDLARSTKSPMRIKEVSWRLGEIALDVQNADKARQHFDERLENVRGSYDLILSYLGLGDTYRAYDNFEEAIRYYDLALEESERSASEKLRPDVLASKAWALLQSERPDEALSLFQELLDANSASTTYVLQAELGMGTLLLNREQNKEALAHFRNAEQLSLRLQRPVDQWKVLFRKAQAYWKLQQHEQADKAFQEAIAIIEMLRENLFTSSNRSYFVQNKVDVYEQYAAFLEAEGKVEAALHYAERARSRGLVDLLFTTQRENDVDTTRLTGQLIEMERRLRALTEELNTSNTVQGEEVSSSVRVAQLREEYKQVDAQYRKAQLSLAPDQRIYTFAPLSTDSMQAALAPGEAMVFFDLRHEEPSIPAMGSVAYVILPDQVKMTRLPVSTSALAARIRFFRDKIGGEETGPGTGWDVVSQRLYEEVMAPVEALLPEGVTHLHLVPEGVLHYLPFAALQDTTGRFLVERYTLSRAPSASIFKLNRDRNPRAWTSILLVGDPNEDLEGARSEVRFIAEDLGSTRQHVLTGSEATEANVKLYAGQYDILHFATHGRFVPRVPERSHLELRGQEALSVEEIGQLDLNAYLVTLSACESALSAGLLSDVPDGDEWIGLSQAFLAAGTPTVMATLWAIDDAVSNDLMVAFYDTLDAAGKAFALAKVQRQFIRNSSTKHPFYWAPFTIVGDPL